MTLPHDWTECYPALLKVGDAATPEDSVAMTAAIETAWATMEPDDRLNFHRLCCLDVRDLPALAAASKFREAIRVCLPARLR